MSWFPRHPCGHLRCSASEERDYYTLVTMGMGAHRMNVPEELAEYKLERAELAIALPPDWKLDEESLKDERWYWPDWSLEGVGPPAHFQRYLAGLGAHNGQAIAVCRGHELCAAIWYGPQDVVERR